MSESALSGFTIILQTGHIKEIKSLWVYANEMNNNCNTGLEPVSRPTIYYWWSRFHVQGRSPVNTIIWLGHWPQRSEQTNIICSSLHSSFLWRIRPLANFPSNNLSLLSLSLFQKLYAVSAYSNRCASTDLRSVMAEKIPKEQERVKAFRKECGNVKVGEVTVDMVRVLLIGQANWPNRRRDYYQSNGSLNNSLWWWHNSIVSRTLCNRPSFPFDWPRGAQRQWLKCLQ